MALSPRSLFRSPIVLLAFAISAGIAVIGMAVFLMSTTCSERYAPPPTMAMDYCQQQIGSVESQWTEVDFVRVASCYDEQNDTSNALYAASRGLGYHPHSESLFNIKAYHQIRLRDYDGAVETLRLGMERVAPTTSIMENNLAWAGLWTPREVDTDEARRLYVNALAKAPQSCETLHTGLWVEYAKATSSAGVQRQAAINAFNALRGRYDGCEKRVSNGELDTVHEVLGAGVLDIEMSRLAPSNGLKPNWARQHSGMRLIHSAMAQTSMVAESDMVDACEMATPVADAHHACVRIVKSLNTTR